MSRHTHTGDDTWMQTHWRPMMAWQYLVVCLFDFMLAPICLGWYAYITKTPIITWVPLTVQGGGLYHLAMGAIVGITSYGKSQERMTLIQSPYMPAPGQVPAPKVAPKVAEDPEK